MFLTVFGWDIKTGYRERGVCVGGRCVCVCTCVHVCTCLHSCVRVRLRACVLCRGMELREDRVSILSFLLHLPVASLCKGRDLLGDHVPLLSAFIQSPGSEKGGPASGA